MSEKYLFGGLEKQDVFAAAYRDYEQRERSERCARRIRRSPAVSSSSDVASLSESLGSVAAASSESLPDIDSSLSSSFFCAVRAPGRVRGLSWVSTSRRFEGCAVWPSVRFRFRSEAGRVKKEDIVTAPYL